MIFRISNDEEFRFVSDKSSAPQNLISAITARKMLRKGYQGYLALVRDTTAEKTSISDIPIACEFPDVFLPNCPVLIESIELLADLVLLDVMDFDVILGMDWLSQHFTTVDCRRKDVISKLQMLRKLSYGK